MKLSIIPLALSAGLAISQVSATPLRVVVIKGQISSSGNDLDVARFAPKPYHHPNTNIATIHAVDNVHVKAKYGCAGSLRAKVSKWLNHIFGLPAVSNHESVYRPPGLSPVHAPAATLTPIPAILHHPTPDYAQHFQRPRTFVQRLTHALMMLGPWEGRAVSFILGCGIGVLIRMFWVLTVVTIRSFRGKKQEDDFLADEVIFEEEHLLPPQYVETVTPCAVKEKNESVMPLPSA